MQLLTAEEVAGRCKMPVEWIDTAISCGKIPAPICLDGHIRWRERDIDRWIEAGCPPATASNEPNAGIVTPEGSLNLGSIEKRTIEEALRVSDGNREEAARLLGVGERTIYRKIREYGIS
jgi:predicted DNA-binding transcriptional regulator AlpA